MLRFRHSLRLLNPTKEELGALKDLKALRLLRVVQPEEGAVEALRAPSSLRSVQIHGRQD